MKHDLCIIGLKCYDHLVGSDIPRYLGGIEKLLTTMGKELATSGSKVAFITYDHGQPPIEEINGITIIKGPPAAAGRRGTKTFHPRMTRLWIAMRKANANHYLQMGAGSETGTVSLGCRFMLRPRRRFTFSIASDADCSTRVVENAFTSDSLLYRYGIRHCDSIVSQTKFQQKELLKNAALRSTVIPLPLPSQPPAGDRREKRDFLWVGRIVPVKRIEWLLQLAKSMPDVRFQVVGTANTESEYSKALETEARSTSNIKIHGRVSDQHLNKLYNESIALLCTSTVEGFPTTFLEAWSRGIPVITTFDPDGIVEKNSLGLVSNSVPKMKTAIQTLQRKSDFYPSISKNCREFFESNYTFDAIMPKYRKLLANSA